MKSVDDLIAGLNARHRAAGTSVRCPVCNVGAGKWCLKAGVTRHLSADDIVIHPARVAAAKAAEGSKT